MCGVRCHSIHVVPRAELVLVNSVSVGALTDAMCCCLGLVQVEGVMTHLTTALQLTEEHLDLMWAVTEKVCLPGPCPAIPFNFCPTRSLRTYLLTHLHTEETCRACTAREEHGRCASRHAALAL